MIGSRIEIRTQRRSRERGMAMLATLSLFLFLTVMITAVLKGNITRRRYLRTRHDQMIALCLAESGIQEALHALGTGPAEDGSIERAVGRGRIETHWSKLKAGDETYELVSIGIARAIEPASARKTICVRVELQASAGESASGPRILSWQIK